MGERIKKAKAGKAPPIYIVSGGAGASGEQIVETVLAQFPNSHLPVVKMPHVRRMDQIESVIEKASKSGGTIVHTLVDNKLRKALVRLCNEKKIATIDLMGEVLNRLTKVLEMKPAGQPGLYRKLHQDYFDRVEAIEFAMNHDDGQQAKDLPLADIVLLGVSRCGKTPLSMYLAVLGWKVANVPLIPGQSLPKELSKVDRRRVIGLSIEYDRLMGLRQKRQERMGITGPSQYTKPTVLFEELEAAKKIYRKGGYSVIGVTNKPIESSAAEIIDLISGKNYKNTQLADISRVKSTLGYEPKYSLEEGIKAILSGQ